MTAFTDFTYSWSVLRKIIIKENATKPPGLKESQSIYIQLIATGCFRAFLWQKKHFSEWTHHIFSNCFILNNFCGIVINYPGTC